MHKIFKGTILISALMLAAGVSTAWANNPSVTRLTALQNARTAILQAITDDKGQIVLGNRDAEYTVALFHDYRCGYCRKLSHDLPAVLKEYPKVRVVVQQAAVLGEESVNAARVALAAQELGVGVQAHQFLVDYTGKAYDINTLVALVAKEAKLKPEDLQKAVQSPAIAEVMLGTLQASNLLGLTGTPALYSQHDTIGGYPSPDKLKKFFEQAQKPLSNNQPVIDKK